MIRLAIITLLITCRVLAADAPVITDVRMQHLLHQPGETATVAYSLSLPGNAEWAGELVITHITGLDTQAELQRRPLKLANGEALHGTFSFPVGDTQFGHELRIQLVQDDAVVAEGSDVFSVARNFWDVALGTRGEGILHSSARYGDRAPEVLASKLAKMRHYYSNWLEKHFWAPDDWGDLTPDSEEWISGQAARYENAHWLKLTIDEAHKHGIKAITYGKGIGGGPAGYELLREKPHYFLRNPNGTWGGNPNVWDLENWQNPELNHYKDFSSVWHRTFPDLSRLDALDHGIDELIASTQRFGWDGVRFDGQFSAVDDVVSTRNMQRLKQRVWAADPDFLFGFNLISVFDRPDELPHEEREAMAGGGMWMQEGIGDFQHKVSVPYRTWRQYAEDEWIAARRIQAVGGSYHYIYRLRGPEAQQYYKFAIGSLNGAHPCYGGHEDAPGARNWGRFLTRWGMLWWHPLLAPLDTAAAGIIATGLNERVLWRHWARTIPYSPQEEWLVLPFLHLPPSDEIEATDSYPEPLAGAHIRLPDALAQRIRQVIWLSPNQDPLVLEPGAVQALPTLDKLGILVIALRGNPRHGDVERPRFTEPVDPQALAASLASGKSKVVVDPLRPELNTLETEPFPPIVKVYAADISWSMSRNVLTDPEAESGRAAGANKALPRCVTGGYFFNLLPGRYRITARVRRQPAGEPIRFSASIYENMKVGSGYQTRDGSMRKKSVNQDNPDGRYQELVLTEDYEHHGLGFCAAFIHAAIAPAAGDDTRFLLDWVMAERLELYDDQKLAQQSGLPDHEERLVGPANHVLWVRGLFDDLYHLNAAFPDATVETVYQGDLQLTAEALAPFGTIVLPNVPVAQFAMQGRKLLRDWTLSGGHLIILGGQLSLGQGAMQNSYLEEVLPCRLTRAADIIRLPQPQSLRPEGQKAETEMLLYYLHEIEEKEGAVVHARCGEWPLLLTGPAGKGRCTVFAGTVLGAPRHAAAPFWNHPQWPILLRRAISQ